MRGVRKRALAFASCATFCSAVASIATAHHLAGRAHAEGESAAEPIRAVIATTYDTADHKVETAPIVVSGDYAVADWVQGTRGGRALLQRRSGAWHIAACAGAAFRTIDGLQSAGVPAETAGQLVYLLITAERSMPADRLKQFDSFGAQDASSPAGHGHHGAK